MFSSQISSKRSEAQQATEVLGQEFLDQISPEGHMFMFYLFKLEPSVKFLFMLSCGWLDPWFLCGLGGRPKGFGCFPIILGLGCTSLVKAHRNTLRAASPCTVPTNPPPTIILIVWRAFTNQNGHLLLVMQRSTPLIPPIDHPWGNLSRCPYSPYLKQIKCTPS
ncbi:hypothetical protein M9H77_18441 [Catharanthus roseus]|uniref:Uncharacterized protein n=1 Tax=Catharanthus roseus TaxID=4058 RepID=A0ACC0B7S3_CATRO|nr:hypothetical protein M9H77_18441 [Catharanthus roseus]